MDDGTTHTENFFGDISRHYSIEWLQEGQAEIRFTAFDTTIRIKGFGDGKPLEPALVGTYEACQEYERLFSRTLEGSDIWRINESRDEWVTIDKRSYELIKAALSYCSASRGVFDITIGPLIRLWDFKRGIIPDTKSLAKAAQHVNWRNVELHEIDDSHQARITDPEASIDLGGIAKGWIADALRDQLLKADLNAFVIDLGGNILVEGEKPGGSPWIVGLPAPSDVASSARITLRNGSVVTSGIYERSFVCNDVRYHHVLDPTTGMPVEVEYPAVTVVCERSIDAEGFSTTLLALGPGKARELIDEHPEILQAFFISWDGTPHPLM